MDLKRQAWEKGIGKMATGKTSVLYATWKFKRRWVWVQLSGSQRCNAAGNDAVIASSGFEASSEGQRQGLAPTQVLETRALLWTRGIKVA